MNSNDEFLNKLYYGEICPAEELNKELPGLQEAMDQYHSLIDQLLGQISEEAEKTYSLLSNARSEVESILRREDFKKGFRMGAACMRECFPTEKNK